MDSVCMVLYMFLGAVLGVGLQTICRPATWVNVLISFGAVAIIPPHWSLGIIFGIWIKCAFFDNNQDQDNRRDQQEAIEWFNIFYISLFTFAGFLLTLMLVWKVRMMPDNGIVNYREWLAWAFLVFIEISFYRVIAKFYLIWQRVKVGLGMGFMNFLMIFYWIYPYGLTAIILTFLSLIIISPTLLIWVDRRFYENDGL